jgi:ketosteroid isomerase-like protein
MPERDQPTEILREYWARIDARDWDGLAQMLDPHLRAHYTHTGEDFDADGLVRFNREYAGEWRATVEEIVGTGDRAVSRARVSNGQQAYHVASFATVQRGRIARLVEVWAESGQPPPSDRRSTH